MKRIYRILLLALLTLVSLQSFSNRFIAGDISWVNVGKDSFMVMLNYYRNCNYTPPYVETLKISNNSGSYKVNLQLSNPAITDVTPSNDTCTRCQSSSCIFPYGFQKYVYSKLVVLDSAKTYGSCLFTFSSKICCRTSAISTGGANYYAYIEAKLNKCLSPYDTSINYSDEGVYIKCIGHDVFISTIPNQVNPLDSFGFSLVYPRSASNSNITYSNPYDYNKPIYFWGFPNANLPFPRGFHLDKYTGQISFRPMKIETTIMCVQIEKFRNGQLISTINRDLYFAFINCPNKAPVLSGPFYKEVCEGDTIKFQIATDDDDTLDNLTISWDQSIPGATWLDSNGIVQHPTGNFLWVTPVGSANPKPYIFYVTVKDDASPISGYSTRAYLVLVKSLPKATISKDSFGCGNYNLKAINIIGSNPTYIWESAYLNGFPKIGQIVALKSNFGIYPFQLTMKANTCESVFYDTIFIDTFLSAEPIFDQEICIGDSLDFKIKEKFSKGPVKYQWSTSPNDTLPDHSLRFYDDLKIIYKVTDTSSCPFEDSFFVNVHQLSTDLKQNYYSCYDDTLKLDPNIVLDGSPINQALWKDVNQNVVSNSDKLSVYNAGKYFLFLTDFINCTYLDTIEIEKNPKIEAYVQDTVICPGDSLILYTKQTGSKTGNVQYEWVDDFGNSTFKQNFTATPTTSSYYNLIVTELLNGIFCMDSNTMHFGVDSVPQVYISPIDQGCISGINSSIIKLNDFLTTSASSIIWSSSTPNAIIPGTDQFYPNIAGVGSHEVQVIVIDPNYNCPAKKATIVKINPLPKVSAGMDEVICIGNGNKTLVGNPLYPSGNWIALGNHQGIEGSTGNYVFNPTANGISYGNTYALLYDYIDSNGCENFDTVEFTIGQLPYVDAGTNESFCAHEKNIDLSLKGTPLNGVWSGAGISNNYFDPSALGRGKYSAFYHVYDSLCTATDEVRFYVKYSPNPDFKAYKTSTIYNTILFQNIMTNKDSVASWAWDFGEGSSSTDESPSYTYQYFGTYTVNMTAYYKNGCSNSMSKIITIDSNGVGLPYIENQDIEIYPNPFDEDIVIKCDDQIQSVKVFNILGKLVYSKNEIDKNSYSIGTKDFAKGIYLLSIETNSQQHILRKMVKEK